MYIMHVLYNGGALKIKGVPPPVPFYFGCKRKQPFGSDSAESGGWSFGPVVWGVGGVWGFLGTYLDWVQVGRIASGLGSEVTEF